ncbi:hypothetical protein SESBI_16466 [Sesbania bispinosa]|nr:hypothetical protein SESBI_16466 [Sesbania bispinosa]
MTNWEIRNFKAHLDYLVDIIGVVTAISPEKDFGYGIGAKKYVSLGGDILHTMNELNLFHMCSSGKVECMLFDDYINVVKDYLKFCGRPRPIIVIQYARVIPLPGPVLGEDVKGEIVVQNYYNATRVMFNGAIPKVLEFKKRVAVLGMAYEDKPTTFSHGTIEIHMKDDFLVLNARKRIGELQVCREAGVFVILARVVGFVETGRWWYYACKCNRPAFPKNDVFYCPGFVSWLQILFLEITEKSCKDLLEDVQDPTSNKLPSVFTTLVGQNLLLKVENTWHSMRGFNDVRKVLRVCDDREIIELFSQETVGMNIQEATWVRGSLLPVTTRIIDTWVACQWKTYGEGPLCYDGNARCVVIKPGGERCSKTMNEIVSFKKEILEDGEHVGDPTKLTLFVV